MQPTLSSQSSQAYLQDPRNRDVQVYVNGEFVHRDNAVVSILIPATCAATAYGKACVWLTAA